MNENKLFYGSMQAHERAYKDQRANEAKNDMILGAQINSLVQMEEAKEQSANDIATRYGAFLKQLKAKDIPLKNLATKRENDIAKLVVSGVMALPSPDPSNVLFTSKSAERAGQAAFDNKIFSANEIMQSSDKKRAKITKLKAIFGNDFDSMFGIAPTIDGIKIIITDYINMSRI